MYEGDFPPIQQRLMEFIRRRFQPGYNHYNVSKLVGDASSRQYYRYVTDSGARYILAAYPEPFDPDRFPFGQVYELLRLIGVPVPKIHEIDGPLGIVLQQDLGNVSLQKKLMAAAPPARILLLREAMDHLVRIQSEGSSRFSPSCEGFHLAFDEKKLTWELRFFRRFYLEKYRGRPAGAEDEMDAEFVRIARELAAYPRVLCHRDYHVRNLMHCRHKLYVIDFQDARWGPFTYDVVSLLKDSIDLEASEIDSLLEHYLSRIQAGRRPAVRLALSDEGSRPAAATEKAWLESFEAPLFKRQFNVMSIQRLLKALGTYAYQIKVRENFIYEQYMAGSLNRTRISLDAVDDFPLIRSIVEDELGRKSTA
ncbi:MAG TPA: phosphotransferase [Acidobacteriota bacterium]|nr:phosphotransferase [Acidobacteriota bacterium]